jgi:hypothetical protein
MTWRKRFLALPLILLLAVIGVWYAGTKAEKVIGPVTLAQASNARWQLPLYTVDPGTIFAQRLNVLYFQIDRGDELQIETYFLEGTQDQPIGSAKLTMYTLLKAGPGQLQTQVRGVSKERMTVTNWRTRCVIR